MKGLKKVCVFSIVGVLTFVIVILPIIFCEYIISHRNKFYNNSGSVHYQRGEYNPAISNYNKAININPGSASLSNITNEGKETSTTEATEEISNNVEQKEKILVKEIYRDPNWDVVWVGTNTLMLKFEKSKGIDEIELIDILENKRSEIRKPKNYDTFVGATSDGRWIIYTDNSCRLAPWLKSPLQEGDWFPGPNDILGPESWFGYIYDIYRYEISSGRTEKIGIRYSEIGWAEVSPDGKKIFLGGAINQNLLEKIDIGEPKWERLYFTTKDWAIGKDVVWFQDSSGIMTAMEKGRLYVEIFGKDRWVKVFETGFEVVDNLQSYRDKTIYFRASKTAETAWSFSLYEGKINEKRELTYRKVLEGKKDNNYLTFVVLPDGDIVFWECGHKEKLIRCITPGQMKEKWTIKVMNKTEHVEKMKVSPDGRWLAFAESPYYLDEYFLYVVKLKD